MRRLNPKKLLLSKWTAVNPVNREMHFLIRSVVVPEGQPGGIDTPLEQFELEAIHSGRTQLIHWRDLQDETKWIQGWK